MKNFQNRMNQIIHEDLASKLTTKVQDDFRSHIKLNIDNFNQVLVLEESKELEKFDILENDGYNYTLLITEGFLNIL